MLASPSVRPLRGATVRVLAVEMAALARTALPLVLAMVGQMAITTTDMLMLGWLGPEALAATALALSAFHPVMLLGVGIGTAVTPLAAAAMAKRQVREMRRAVRQGFWAAVPFTLLAIPALWWSGGVFVAIGQDPGLSDDAERYLRGVLPGLFFVLAFSVLRSYATALQHTRPVLIVTLLAIPFNALLTYGLIFGTFGLPRLEILGAGLGSAITGFAMAMAMLWVVLRRLPFRRHHILGRFWRPDWPIFRAIHRIGIPIGLFILLEVGIFAGSAQVVGFIGVYELAAHQIVLQLASITFMVPLGVGQAVTARVALARGRADSPGARLAGQAAMLLATAFMSCTALLFWFLPAPLIRPFLDGSPAAVEVLAFATGYLAIAAVFQIVDGLQVTAAHALRGLEDTRVPLLIAFFGFWVLAFPTSVILGLFTPLAGSGVWIGLALGLATAACLLIRRFLRQTRPHAGAAAD